MATEDKRYKHAQRSTEAASLAIINAREQMWSADTKRLTGTLEDNTVAYEGGYSVRYMDRWTTLTAAISDFGSSDIHLIITNTVTLTANVVVPTNVTLEFKGAGVIALAGFTLTVNGYVVPTVKQIVSGSGTVAFNGNSYIIPQWFGAKGDGSTDDAAAMSLWIAALGEYQTALIPSGHFIINSDTWSDAYMTIPNSNVSIVGEGQFSSKIEITGTTKKGIFYAVNKNNISLSGFTGKGNATAQSGAFEAEGTCIWFQYTDAAGAAEDGNITVKDVYVDNFAGPYQVGVSNTRTATTYPIENITYTNIYYRNGNDPNPTAKTQACRAVGCHCPSGGIIKKVFISKCNIDAADIKTGINCQGVIDDIVIDQCIVKNAGQTDGTQDTTKYGIECYDGCTSVVIKGCIVDNAVDCGIYLLDMADFVIQGCNITNCSGSSDTTLPKGGVALNASSGVVTGCYFADNKYHFQSAGNQSKPTQIVGNKFDSGEIKIQVPLKTTGTDVYGGRISDNYLEDTALFFFDNSGQDKYLYDFEIAGNQFVATAAEISAFIQGSGQRASRSCSIRGNSFRKLSGATMNYAILGSGGSLFGSGLQITGNTFKGDWDLYCISLTSANNDRYLIQGNRFYDHAGTGYIFFTDSIEGLLNNNEYYNCAMNKIVNNGTNSLGYDRPTFAGETHGSKVENWSDDDPGLYVFDKNTHEERIVLNASGYVNCVAGDIGKTVEGGPSGATGILRAYDNATYTWDISDRNDIPFDTGTPDAITITTGTGAGNLVSTSIVNSGWVEQGRGAQLYNTVAGTSGGTKEIVISLNPGLEYNFAYDFTLKQAISSTYWDFFSGILTMFQNSLDGTGSGIQKVFTLTELHKTTGNYFVTGFDVNIDVKSATTAYTGSPTKNLIWDQDVSGEPTELKIVIGTAIGGQSFAATEVWIGQRGGLNNR